MVSSKTKKWIYTKFAQGKCDAKVCKLKSKTCAKVVNAAFAHLFTRGCKQVCKCGIYPLCTGFAPQFAHLCITFALSKFGANPFFRPVAPGQLNSKDYLTALKRFSCNLLRRVSRIEMDRNWKKKMGQCFQVLMPCLQNHRNNFNFMVGFL